MRKEDDRRYHFLWRIPVTLHHAVCLTACLGTTRGTAGDEHVNWKLVAGKEKVETAADIPSEFHSCVSWNATCKLISHGSGGTKWIKCVECDS